MKKWQKEIEGILLDDEEEVLHKLEKTYQQSLKDVQAHAKQLQNDIDKLIADDPDNENQIRAKVYQLQYQQALEKQINGYMDVIKDKNTKDISDYLNTVYSDGFMTQQYALMNQGVNVTMPINQKMLVKSVTYKTEDIPLSTRIYKNVEKAKKTIISEISRGLSTGMSNADISRNLKNAMGVSSRKAWQLAQNEGARVRQDAITDVGNEAKKRGADVVKQWSATLDGKTRPVHAELDEKWAELDEDFEYSGGTVSAPKKFGIASLDINCRCSLLIVPRWDVEGSKSSLRRDNVTKETVRVDNYQDWKIKYLKEIEESRRGEIKKATKANLDYLKTKEYNNKFDGVVSKVASAEIRNTTKKIIRENSRTENESYAFIDNETGKVIFVGNAGKLGGYTDVSVLNKYSNVTLTHNHPYSSSFSIDDILIINNSNKISTIVAGGHDGTVYILSFEKKYIIGLEKEYTELYGKYKNDSHKVMLELAKRHGWKYERK